VFVTGASSTYYEHTAHIYRVDTAGNPNTHPDNPLDTGLIATRTFTEVGTPYFMGNYPFPEGKGHRNNFHIDATGIYYGASAAWGGITHWDFGWTNKTLVAPTPPGVSDSAQTLAYDPDTGTWWVGDTDRRIYSYDTTAATPAWVYEGTHKALGEVYHDGLAIKNGQLFVSGQQADWIAMYELDGDIDWADPDEEYTYTESADVEGMSFGPNGHLWVSGWESGTFYELGPLGREVPEPSSLLLMLVGSVAFGLSLRRRQRG